MPCRPNTMPLAAVSDLSDEEGNVPAPGPKRKRFCRMPARGFRVKRSMPEKHAASTNPVFLAHLIRRKCGCQAGCFAIFRSRQRHFDDWVKVRKQMASMTKLEKDQYAWNLPISRWSLGNSLTTIHHPFWILLLYLIRIHVITSVNKSRSWPPVPIIPKVFSILKAQDQQACRGSRHLRFLGNPVCNRAFMMLFAIGKYRFKTLNGAARKGEEFCPFDGRYVIRGNRAPSTKWEKVHGFLMRLYLEVAEPIPDGLNSNKRPRHGSKKFDAANLDRSQMRHLPFGTINDYWRQCMAALPDLDVSRKLFCSAPWSHSCNCLHV